MLYALFAYIFSLLYHPDTTAIIESMKAALFEMRQGDIRPEPLERALYSISFLFFPLSLFFIYTLSQGGQPFKIRRTSFSSWFNQPKFAKMTLLFCLGVWLLLGINMSLAPNPFMGEEWMASDVYPSCFAAYFGTLIIIQKPIMAVFFFLIIGLIFLWQSLKPESKTAKFFDWVSRIAGYAIAIILLFFIVLMNATNFPETWQNQYDLNPVMFSQTQVWAGNAMLVNELINIYGLYPHFLNPIFQIFGLSVYSFTLVMSLLIVLGYIFIYFALHFTLKNRLLGILGFVSLILLPYVSGHTFSIENFDSYFPTFPIRTTFPFLTLLLASKRNRFTYFAGNLLLPLGILFDPDMGAVSFVAWSFYILYADFWGSDGRVNWKKELKNIACLLGGLIISCGTFTIIIRLKYGAFPAYSLLFDVMKTYSGGFYTLPMQILHPWMAVALIGITGLGWGLAKFFKKTANHRDAFILLLGLMVFGSFAYFQSRSHNANLWIPAFYAYFLLILFADMLWSRIKDGEKFYWFPFTVILFFLSISLPESYAEIPRLQRLSQPYHGNSRPDDFHKIKNNKAFMDAHLREDEKTTVLTTKRFYALYYTDRKLSCCVYPGYLEIYLKRSYEHMLSTILQSQSPIFIDNLSLYYPEFNSYRAAIASRYEVLETNENQFSLLRPRIDSLPTDTLILPPTRKNPGPILFRKYTDDSAGYRLRMADAAGTDSVYEGTHFVVEVLFKNTLQHYPSVLVSNEKDSTGGMTISVIPAHQDSIPITITRISYSSGLGVEIKLSMNQWHYLVVQVEERYLGISDNGSFLGWVDMRQPYLPSKYPFYIGNINDQRNFVGAISEVCIYEK